MLRKFIIVSKIKRDRNDEKNHLRRGGELTGYTLKRDYRIVQLQKKKVLTYDLYKGCKKHSIKT